MVIEIQNGIHVVSAGDDVVMIIPDSDLYSDDHSVSRLFGNGLYATGCYAGS